MKVRISTLVVLAACLVTYSLASDPPDSTIHPLDNSILTVDSYDEDDYEIRFVERKGDDCKVTILSANTSADLSPRVAITTNGDTYVVWWRDLDTDLVLYRRLDYSTGTWTEEIVTGDQSVPSRNPEAVSDGETIWIAYEEHGAADPRVVTHGLRDGPEPFGITFVTHGNDIDTNIHYESNHLWVTWIDSINYVGYSEYDYSAGTWGGVELASFAADTPADARERIRETILD